MKKVTNKMEYDEIIDKVRESVEWYDKRNFDNRIYNVVLDNGEKLRICFSHNSLAHLLGIDTEYLKSTGVFPKDSYDILKSICNDSYRLYSMVQQGNLTYDSFISNYIYEKLEGFQSICGIDLYNIEFVCKYSKEYSYITGHPQLEADYYIGYKTNNGLHIIGLKRNGNYYYPMTNRYVDFNDEETMKFLKQMLENQAITMPTKSDIYFRETNSNSRSLYLDYNKKASKIRLLNSYAKKYNAVVDVSCGYSYVIEKLLSQFNSKNLLFPALECIFEKVSKRLKINVLEIEMEYGELPEDIISLIDAYNDALSVDINAALDEHTQNMIKERDRLSEENKRHLEELQTLRKELIEAKSAIETLREENSNYQKREEETISAMKRIYQL